MDSPVAGDARLSHLPPLFTRDEGRAMGMSDRQMARSCRRLFRGAYCKPGADPTLAEQVSFALRVIQPARFATQHTAAQLMGAIVPQASNLHLGTRQRLNSQRDGIRLHFYVRPPELTLCKGIPITAPAQTFLDLARSLEFADLLVLGDSLVKRRLCTPAQLAEFAAASSAHGAPHAREVAAWVRPGVESPNESRLRLLVVSGGLPEPTINPVVHIPGGTRTRRPDLAFEEWKVAVEFDGRHHLRQWEADMLRREELEALGWRLVHVSSTELYTNPWQVLQRIADALVLAGAPRAELSENWRRHFRG
jgi:hypothetical protein